MMEIKSMMDVGRYCHNNKYVNSTINIVIFVRPHISSWDLNTFLIKPVQRVLKYPLLLKKILESTPTEHASQKVLERACRLSSDVAHDINEIKRRKDICKYYQHMCHIMLT